MKFELGLKPRIVIHEAHSMPVSMYTVSIPVFIQHLNGLNTVLDKAAAGPPRARSTRPIF